MMHAVEILLAWFTFGLACVCMIVDASDSKGSGSLVAVEGLLIAIFMLLAAKL